ncbi:hypothetical protein CsatB_000174 [Cannabis sativa]
MDSPKFRVTSILFLFLIFVILLFSVCEGRTSLKVSGNYNYNNNNNHIIINNNNYIISSMMKKVGEIIIGSKYSKKKKMNMMMRKAQQVLQVSIEKQGGHGRVFVSKRVSPGGPDPHHH